MLWAPWVPALHPQELGVHRGRARDGAGTLPPPTWISVSVCGFPGAPRAAGGMGTLTLTQPLSSVCLFFQEPPSV